MSTYPHEIFSGELKSKDITEKQQASNFHSFVIKGDYQDIIHDCSRSSRHISLELPISLTYCH